MRKSSRSEPRQLSIGRPSTDFPPSYPGGETVHCVHCRVPIPVTPSDTSGGRCVFLLWCQVCQRESAYRSDDVIES